MPAGLLPHLLWILTVSHTEVCHHLKAEKCGPEASGHRDLAVTGSELFPEHAVVQVCTCIWSVFPLPHSSATEQNKQKRHFSWVHMSTSKGLHLVKPLWFAVLSCSSPARGTAVSMSFSLAWEIHGGAAGYFLSVLHTCPAIGTAGWKLG